VNGLAKWWNASENVKKNGKNTLKITRFAGFCTNFALPIADPTKRV
jgi:hypothetical protein